MDNVRLHKLWAEEYLAAPGDNLGPDSDLVREVESDEVNLQHIETTIQQLIPTMDVARRFCSKCRHLLDHWPDLSVTDWNYAKGRSFSSVSEIEAGARTGCEFCTFLFSQLLRNGYLSKFRKIESRLLALGNDVTIILSIQSWVQGPVLWLNLPEKEATHCNHKGACCRFDSDVMGLSAKLWQEKTDMFEIARIWLHECCISHRDCRSTKEYSRPSRLISFDQNVARVVLTEMFDIRPQYATLSYCWGRKSFLKLTTDTMDSFLGGVAIKDIPKTFQDAIYVARELGLSYIWIDALCIIQQKDGYDDWLRELGLMESIYGNSYVNIAASSATNVRSSLFSKPENYSEGFCARVTTSEYCTVQSFFNKGLYHKFSHSSHLATRGWTLQERLLPPRTMFLGDSGIFWECRSTTRSEFSPDMSLAVINSDHLLRPENQHWPWDKIVMYYSGTILTNPSDRLPALAGVARRQHQATGHHYLAGIWREDLVYQITWMVVGKRRKRPVWRAPSWSWIAVDGRVELRTWSNVPGMTKHVSVSCAWTEPSGLDPFGQVSSGFLTLECSALVRAQLLEPKRSEETVGEQEVWRCLLTRMNNVNADFPISIDCLEDYRICSREEVYLLPISSFPLNNLTPDDSDSDDSESDLGVQQVILGLVLQGCGKDAGNQDHYYRIGSFSFVNNFGFCPNRDHYEEFMQVLDEERAETGEAGGSDTLGSQGRLKDNFHITIK
ncbi:HET-domain-containing protein [Colletotrichum zoysiae]|uniref:HET-domain-containing protein n=1 Tax=Colletotrichum zoysiae TaxID=1216348 RepID=A0AAD9HQX9_9PEZI|nr:HET-domain-containing protein [Colletotrichum zoysiae]